MTNVLIENENIHEGKGIQNYNNEAFQEEGIYHDISEDNNNLSINKNSDNFIDSCQINQDDKDNQTEEKSNDPFYNLET